MESDVTQSALIYKIWAWFEVHKKQVFLGCIAALLLAMIIGFVIWRQKEKQVNASEALSILIAQGSTQGEPASPEAFVKVAEDHPHTGAAARALLIAGQRYFSEGKYSDAQAQFQRFLGEYGNLDYSGQASFGIAASLEALGKTDDALNAYKTISERRGTESIAVQARLAMGRIYEANGDLKLARDIYQQLARSDFGSIGREAGMRLEELFTKHPELMEPVAQPAMMPMPTNTVPAATVLTVTNTNSAAGATNDIPVLRMEN